MAAAGTGHQVGAMAREIGGVLKVADSNGIDLDLALRLLAYMGDLSMGQPADHSSRAAWLACRMGEVIGLGEEARRDLAAAALLRWSGCTANAGEVGEALGDDVGGRAALLAEPWERLSAALPGGRAARVILVSTVIHCEVSSLIAGLLGLPPPVAAALQAIFESWDGTGPLGQAGEGVPLPAYLSALAGDADVLSRVHGQTQAIDVIRRRAGLRYPPDLALRFCDHLPGWLGELERGPPRPPAAPPLAPPVSLALMADVIDLKLPWLAGHSRAVAALATRIAGQLGLAAEDTACLRRAGLLHGLGRVAVPNRVWGRPGPLSDADWEKVRLAPYWTARLAARLPELAAEADLASHVGESCDGTGYFRAIRLADAPLGHRILPVAAARVAMAARRPWRLAMDRRQGDALMLAEAERGRFDLRATTAILDRTPAAAAAPPPSPILTPREIEILRQISRGDSNKAAARRLGISPATVRTHVESAFAKLDVRSRAAATLKASMLGLL